MKKFLLLFLLLLPCFRPVAAAREPFLFSHIRTGRESMNLEVNCIFRDSDGFVWFGTSRGLLRYNGAEITAPPAIGGEPLLDDYISTIQEDARGRLWILANDERYVVYDRLTKRCSEDAVAELHALTGRDIAPVLLYIDPKHDFWISDGRQVCRFRHAAGELHTLARDGARDAATLRAMFCRGDRCYLLYASGAVEAVDVRTLAVTATLPPPLGSVQAAFSQLFVDSRDGVWITDRTGGVWYRSAASGRWEHFEERAARRISNNSVRDVTEDAHGNIWIATDHGGIDVFHPASGRIEVLTNDPYDRTSLTSNSVYSLFRDAEQNIWVGYYKRGVSLYSPSRQKFFTRHIRGLRNRNLQDDISAICEDRQGNLWFGTDEFGVVRQNRSTGEETFFRAGSGPLALGSDVVVCLYCDTQGRVWIGTYLGGLSCYDRGRMVHYRHDGKDANSLSSNSIWAIDEDCDGSIWIGTLDGGVQRLDPRTGTFETIAGAPGGPLSSGCVLDLSCVRCGVIYVATVNGVEALDVRSRRYEMLVESRDAKVMNICRDSRGLLWIVDKRGEVSAFDPREKRYVPLPAALTRKNFRSVTEDDNKNIWLATDRGFYNLIVGADPLSGAYTFTTYRYAPQESDELQTASYNVRAIARMRNGEIVFGSTNGYFTINPNASDLGTTAVRPARVLFTGLQIDSNPIEVGAAYDGDVILERGLEFTERIDLRYRQNRFALEFSPLDYSSPFKTEYYYQMEGFSDEWLPVGGEGYSVSFTNLSPGEYRMRIRALNTDGTLGEDAAALRIVVHPPFWRTTLAYLLYTLAALCMVWAVISAIFRRQQRKLEQQRAEMESERQNQLNEMKIRFFTNISHDFRTPLSLIITPVEELRERCGDELRPYLEIVHRNATRLLNLVNQLLDFRKLDVYGTSLNLSHGDFVAFVREICSSFELLSEDAHTTLAVESAIERLEMDFDKDKMSKVLMNLLSNAFKYTTGEGHVSVEIGTRADDNGREQVSVAVRDTGVGIPDRDKPHIFDRFYQVDRGGGVREGSGIGLHIVREFIALHGGSISVADNAPRGSLFRFVLPVSHAGAADASECAAPAQPAAAAAQARPTILLVEDNAEFRGFMRESLARENDIVEAADGVEALEVLQRATVDVIISDVMMPRMDGLELCKEVKGNIRTSHIPIILLTARAMQEHEREGLAVGADDYITKPFNLSILKLRISKLIEWTKRSHELFRKTAEINPSEITITSLDEKLIENAVKIVEENMDNSEFSVEELSSRLGMHRTHLYKKLTFITGKGPLEFIRIVRLKRAAQLLRKSRMNVSEVAYMVGFNSPKIFTRYFREEFGLSPREYLRNRGDSGTEDASPEEVA